ncbi:hypothetical protein D3C87_2181020 [compost metagenome]
MRGDKRGFGGLDSGFGQRWREILRDFYRFTNRRRGFVGKRRIQPLRQFDGRRKTAGE